MKRVWAFAALAAFVVALGSFVAAQQATTKPTAQKPVVKKEAKTEKEDEEKEGQEGAKKYTISVQLPPAITAAFKKSYPTSTIRGTAQETEGGKTLYEVESLDKGKARDLMYNADGTVISIEEETNAVDLPAPITAALKKLYPKAAITAAEKVTEGKTIQYDLQLKGAAVTSVSFLPDGKVAPPEAPEKK
jgi:hypothetical protein